MLAQEVMVKEIEKYLTMLITYAKSNSRMNLTDIGIVSENFFSELLNKLYGYKLINANSEEKNFAGIDLIDRENKICYQVTLDSDADKVQSTISMFIKKEYYNDFQHLFVLVIDDPKRYNKKFDTEGKFVFDKNKDIIFPLKQIIDDIRNVRDLDKLNKIYSFFRSSFYYENFDRGYEWYKNQNEKNILNLGCRYNKEINIDTTIVKKMAVFLKEEERMNTMAHELKELIIKLVQNSGLFQEKKIIEKAKELFKNIMLGNYSWDKVNEFLKELDEALYKEFERLNNSSINYDIYNKISDIRSLNEDLIEGLSYLFKKVMIITGEMGIGKSHLIANWIDKYCIPKQINAILLLGQMMNEANSFTLQMKNELGIEENFEKFLAALDAIGREKKVIVPFFIDALNESQYYEKWADNINGIVNEFSKYKNIKLILTIKEDFKGKCLPNNMDQENVITVLHRGFAENTYEAMNEIFSYYKVELPLFPVINETYSNPLFLITMCKCINKNRINLLLQDYSDFNLIFDEYLKNINYEISKKLKYSEKENLVVQILDIVAKYMVDNKIQYITKINFLKIIKDHLSLYNIAPMHILEYFISENILYKSIDYKTREEIVYFTYEKYNSIIKSKYILKDFHDRDSIIENQKLKDMFDYENELYDGNIIENLLIYIGNNFGIELYDILDYKLDKYRNVIRIYMRSLMWRKKDNFDIEGKFKEFFDYVVAREHDFYYNYVELLFTCAVIGSSPFNIYKINQKLLDMSLIERDSSWTIMLDEHIEDSIQRILDYCFRADLSGMHKDNRLMLSITLSWMLSSSNRKLRDLATKALVITLTNNLETMVDIIQNFKDVNDMYILERIYGACYGAILRSSNLDKLNELVEKIYSEIFNKEEVIANVVIRDYARQIILYAKYKKIEMSFNIERINPPYKSKWYEEIPTNEQIKKYDINYDDAKDKKYLYAQYRIVSSMITEYGRGTGGYGDFGRYVFERLVRPWKYKFDNPQDLSNIVIKRVFDMGYDAKIFGNYDMNVSPHDRHNNCTERIGKKYQWIATYELLAKLQDKYKIFTEVYPEEEELDFNSNIYLNSKYEKTEVLEDIRYKEDVYQFLDFGYLRNIDVTSTLTKLERKEYEILDIVDKEWINEDIDVEKYIENSNEYISLCACYHYRSDAIELKDITSNFDRHRNSISLTVMYHACLVNKEYKIIQKDMEGFMDYNIHSNFDVLLREYVWSKYYDEAVKYLEKKSKSCNIYPVFSNYLFEPLYDNSIENAISMFVPSKMLIEELKLNQREDGYWYNEDGILVCYDNKLKGQESNFIFNKDILYNYLEKKNFKLIWKGYIDKSNKREFRDYHFIILKEDDKYKIKKENETRGTLTL